MKVILMFSIMAVGLFVAFMLMALGISMILKATRKKQLFTTKQSMLISGCLTLLCVIIMVILAYRPNPLNKTNRGYQAKQDIMQLANAIEKHYEYCERYPNTLSDLLNPTSSDCRMQQDTAYLERIKQDPWERDYIYEYSEKGFSIISLGSDGKEGGTGHGADIIIRR